MKRLFQIYDTQTRKTLAEHYATKHDAKIVRSDLNKDHDTPYRFVVTPGPDHARYPAHHH